MKFPPPQIFEGIEIAEDALSISMYPENSRGQEYLGSLGLRIVFLWEDVC